MSIGFLRVADAVLGDMVFIPDGNHRIAQLHALGVREVLVPVVYEGLDGSTTQAWLARIDAVQNFGIYSVGDYADFCQRGKFYSYK